MGKPIGNGLSGDILCQTKGCVVEGACVGKGEQIAVASRPGGGDRWAEGLQLAAEKGARMGDQQANPPNPFFFYCKYHQLHQNIKQKKV